MPSLQEFLRFFIACKSILIQHNLYKSTPDVAQMDTKGEFLASTSVESDPCGDIYDSREVLEAEAVKSPDLHSLTV